MYPYALITLSNIRVCNIRVLPIILLWIAVLTSYVDAFLAKQTAAEPNSTVFVTPVVAIDPRHAICYMETEDGRVIDLSRVCGAQESQPIGLSAIDQRFLRNYQAALRDYLTLSLSCYLTTYTH